MPQETVLVTVYSPRQPFWSLPVRCRDLLEDRFRSVEWVHVPGWESDFGPGLAKATVWFGWHLPEPAFLGAPRLRWMHSGSAGVRRLLYPALVDSEVVLTNSSGAHAPFMAEQMMGWMLSWVRRDPQLERARAQREWAGPRLLQENPPETLLGKTLLIVGYGAVGRELAVRARAFGMRVVGVRRSPQAGGEVTESGMDSLDRLLGEADVVANVLPYTEATRGLFDRGRLMRIRPGAFFMNVGRGATVDEDALIDVLRSGHLAGTGLDVFAREPLPPESPLWSLPTVRVAPHIGGAAVGIWDRLVDRFAENLERHLTGELLRNVVDPTNGY